MKKLLVLIAVLLIPKILLADSMLLGDAKEGQSIHEKVCVACHDSSAYTRENRIVKSIGGLVARVNGCNTQLDLALPKDKIDDVVKYLNDTYYKFEK